MEILLTTYVSNVLLLVKLVPALLQTNANHVIMITIYMTHLA